MNYKLQIFVSSTYLDLLEERQTAVKTILESGHIPAGMELFRAGKAVKNTLQKWIDDSDIYLLILGGRYGSIDDNTGKSFTQWEYEYAIDTGKPTFAIVLSDTYLREKEKEQKGDIFETENKEKYDKFKKLVLNKTVYKVNSLSEITSKILIQLQEYTVDPKLVKHGWIRINTAAEPSTAMGKDLFQQLYFENLFGSLTVK